MFRLALPLACGLALFGATPGHAQDDELREAVQRYVDNPIQQRMNGRDAVGPMP